jgi:hypothetical protein
LGVPVGAPRLIGSVDHQLSHRQYHFDVYLCQIRKAAKSGAVSSPTRRWVTWEELGNYPKPRPHVEIAGMVREIG